MGTLGSVVEPESHFCRFLLGGSGPACPTTLGPSVLSLRHEWRWRPCETTCIRACTRPDTEHRGLAQSTGCVSGVQRPAVWGETLSPPGETQDLKFSAPERRCETVIKTAITLGVP